MAEEFFQQGDLEQQELKATPMAMMDRAKKDELPQMQVGFIDSVCLPLYKVNFEDIHFINVHVKSILTRTSSHAVLLEQRKCLNKKRVQLPQD